MVPNYKVKKTGSTWRGSLIIQVYAVLKLARNKTKILGKLQMDLMPNTFFDKAQRHMMLYQHNLQGKRRSKLCYQNGRDNLESIKRGNDRSLTEGEL